MDGNGSVTSPWMAAVHGADTPLPTGPRRISVFSDSLGCPEVGGGWRSALWLSAALRLRVGKRTAHGSRERDTLEGGDDMNMNEQGGLV